MLSIDGCRAFGTYNLLSLLKHWFPNWQTRPSVVCYAARSCALIGRCRQSSPIYSVSGCRSRDLSSWSQEKFAAVLSAAFAGGAELDRERIPVSWSIGVTLNPVQGLAGFFAGPYLGGAPIAALIASILVLLGAIVLVLRRRAATQGRAQPFPDELAMLRAIVGSLPDLIYVKDAHSRFLLGNQGVVDTVGAASCADLVGKTDFDYFPADVAGAFYEDEQKILQSGQPLVERDEHLQLPDGRERWILTTKVPYRDAQGQTIGIIGIGRNITAIKDTEAELKRSRENLHFKATHDGLTSLLNREAILDMLGREMARAGREGSSAAVLLADLDHFKQINDRFGHPVGDEVLRETARRFLRAVRSYDLVGRYGGEEFLILLGGCPGSEAMARADQLRRAVEDAPMHTSSGPIPLTISIGVLPAREWGYPAAAHVLREVDIALYAAKAGGRNRCSLASRPAPTPEA
jgi:diguanylate cyclase (GGDEF)-like protein/PAS domain S-box-containing protein